MSSRTADIDFTFAREATVRTIVEALATSGWSLEEPLSYMINDNDLYDWQSTTNDHTGKVLALLDAPENAKYHVAVCVYHAQAGTGGQLLFFPHRTACSFSPTGTAAGLGDSGVYAARAAAGVMMVSYSTGVNRARRL
ncbi:hypothetical protein [Streptomyces sp. NPDC056921]|uniref:hypothetical protein n=1 Tax=Streptomyces sp. NPDC056921 TaxID=3345966 RepID=UPI003641CB70